MRNIRTRKDGTKYPLSTTSTKHPRKIILAPEFKMRSNWEDEYRNRRIAEIEANIERLENLISELEEESSKPREYALGIYRTSLSDAERELSQLREGKGYPERAFKLKKSSLENYLILSIEGAEEVYRDLRDLREKREGSKAKRIKEIKKWSEFIDKMKYVLDFLESRYIVDMKAAISQLPYESQLDIAQGIDNYFDENDFVHPRTKGRRT